MLDAGFTTLDHLKSRLLPDAAREESDWDAALSKLGLAVAGQMEIHCNRRFVRVENNEHRAVARRYTLSLQRYPVEVITSIDLGEGDGTSAYTGERYDDLESGVIHFRSIPGSDMQRLIVTYTGGYWLDPLDGETTIPDGATALPDDLLELWISEVQTQAVARGIFGAVALRPDKEVAKAAPATGLSENTVEGLRGYRRFSGE